MSKPKWTPIKVKLGEIRAWEDNPRLSTKAQALRIIDSEKKFGQPVPFLLMPVDGNKYPLIDGHQRLAAWRTVYGDDYAMDAMVSDRALTDAEHKEMIITLHTGATGSWDWNALASWDASELRGWGMDAAQKSSWDNDSNNLKELLAADDDADEYDAGMVDVQNQFGVIVICDDEAMQRDVYETLLGMGYNIKVVVV